MHGKESRELERCLECGATVAPATDRAFAISDEAVLCFACAERRGGRFDEARDGWIVPPDLSGLPDERRPHP